MEPPQMSTPEPLQETLIPAFPNDVALNILARVPRSVHPILASVSKPIRSLISCPFLYATRALLNSSQPSLYLTLRVPSTRSLLFYTLHHSPNRHRPLLVPIPPLPSPPLVGSAVAVVGHILYLIGGSVDDVPSCHVWAFDCRLHTWERAPSMRVAREFPAAGVVDGKVYVIGGCLVDTWAKNKNWAEVFDPETDTWQPVVHTECEVREKWMHASVVIGGKIYAMADRGGVKFDPKEMSWNIVETELDIGWRGRGCVIDGVLYCYDYLGNIRGFDGNMWRDVKGLVEGEGVEKKGLSLPRFLCGATLANVGGNLVVVWEGKGAGEVEIWCAEIEVEKGEGRELWGKILWSNLVLKVPKGSMIVNCAAVTV